MFVPNLVYQIELICKENHCVLVALKYENNLGNSLTATRNDLFRQRYR